MAKQFFKLTFPQERITEPFLYELGKKFNLVTNIFRANVTQDAGWVLLQVDGTNEHCQSCCLGPGKRREG